MSEHGLRGLHRAYRSGACRFARWARRLAVLIALGLVAHAAEDRLRLVIETDAGGDPDDEQSLVRFLLYVNEWDVQGIIANRPVARAGENRNRERTGLAIVRQLVTAYGQCYTNLIQHDPRYPPPADLLRLTVAGYDDTEDAVALLMRAVDAHDPRPLWYSDWGSDRGSATNNLKRALDRVLRERGSDGYARFKNRLRLVSYDKFGEHTRSIAPPWRFWLSTYEPEWAGRRWYHRFSVLTAAAGGFDPINDLLVGHGPLGALYPTNTTHWLKEGDSMTFLYLVPTGMNEPDQPAWGSWAGRYGLRPGDAAGQPYFWANQEDHWMGSTNRDNTLRRWAGHLQNDFRARLDWCVRGHREANHPPHILLNGTEPPGVVRLHAQPGTCLTFDTHGTRDPDHDSLSYDWFIYPEAGSYRGAPEIQAARDPRAHLTIPLHAAGRTLHLVVAVTDTGEPPLTRYRRAVIEVADREADRRNLAPFFHPPAPFADALGGYRSPLQFSDGSAVAAAADWPRRRAEIRRDWMELMGPWPPVLEKPQMEILRTERRDNFAQHRVRLEIAPGQRSEGWLLVPHTEGPRPAALVVYYEPETSIGVNPEQPLRDFGLQLARRGFVTLNIGTPGGNAWNPATGGALCQPLSFHAYVAANGWHALANLPEVDPARIGIVGHSYGGKWALFGAALWDKFAAVAVSDPGIVFDETRPNVNYWEPWYLGLDPQAPRRPAGLPSNSNPRTGAYRRLIEGGRDLHELHALLAPRPFLVSGGAEDPPERWLALNHLVAVNRVLGVTHRVAMTQRKEHSPDTTSNAQLYAFFEYFLGPDASPGE
jgi:hypothetical protein